MSSGTQSGSDAAPTDRAPTDRAPTDLFIIGGGINGCGIARDAAGRGLSVRLAEAGDLAQATSSASTKLFHGGLRYLEFLEFRLVRESLREREVLLAAMPHIAHPLRFVLPIDPAMRFDTTTPVSKMLPWMRGRRPASMIRAGLFLYDHLGTRKLLPGTARIDLTKGAEGEALRPDLTKAYEYSDVWVDDARLVVLNAVDASARGADILTRAQVADARAEGGLWHITLRDGRRFTARALVNAAGPWAAHVVRDLAHLDSRAGLRLVRGSHIVTRRLYPHDKAYFLQGPDGRIIFLIPYEDAFTLIGTTDLDHDGDPAGPYCTEAERDYLIAFANRYLRQPISAEDVVWSFSGVRGLYDDGADSATAATRDYVLELEGAGGPPCLSVFGGKITTYRRLAEAAMAKLLPAMGRAEAGGTADGTGDWTAAAPLPGGDFPVGGLEALSDALASDFAFLDGGQARRMARAYGTDAWAMLRGISDPGRDFGAGLREVELDWMAAREWAQTGEDALFRRSKLGLHMDGDQRAAVADWFATEG